jgi:CYTH domain-containing protein
MLEIERRYLLKRIPIEPPKDVIRITQWYMEVDGVNTRVRQRVYGNGNPDWTRTIKTYVDEMTCIEDEVSISIEEYEDFRKKCYESDAATLLEKKRLVYENNGDTWEVDEYLDFELIMAEIEMPNKEYVFEIPEHIQDEIIMEVTGIKEFSNYSLSEKIN